MANRRDKSEKGSRKRSEHRAKTARPKGVAAPRTDPKNKEDADLKHEVRVKKQENLLDLREKESDEKEKAGFRRLLTWLIVVFVVIAAIALLYFLLIVDTITVDGCVYLDPDEIVSLSGLKTNTHIWLNRIGEAKERLLEDSHIESVKINRVYPDKIEIILTERARVAEIVNVDGTIVIDEDGYVLDINPSYDTSSMLQVYGMGTVGYQLGQPLSDAGTLRTGTLLSILESLISYDLLAQMRELDVSNALSIKLITQEGLTIMVGQMTDIDAKFRSLPDVLASLSAEALLDGTLYLSVSGDHVYSPAPTAQQSDEGAATDDAVEDPAEDPAVPADDDVQTNPDA